MLEQAIEYLRKGKSIIPLRKDKRPLLNEWREYQTRRPTEQELTDWWLKWPEANIGLVTGKISGVTVIDVDIEHGGTVEGLPPTLIVKTGNGGWHYYYQYAEGITIGAGLRQGVDFRGDGGFVVAPPSVTDYTDKNGNKKGGKYEFILLEEMAPFPIELFPQALKKKVDWENVLQGVGEGERNMTTASLSGKLIGSFKKEDWETLAWPMMKLWNARNSPPDDEKIVRRTFESVMKKHIIGQPEEQEIKIITMAEAAAMQDKSEKVPMGVPLLDDAMGGGVSIGSSIILAAPSGEGKTAFMVTLSHALLTNGYHTLWFSYEENISDIWERFKQTGIPENIPAFCPLDITDNKLNFIEEAIKVKKKTTDFFVVFIDQLSFLAPKVTEKTEIDKIQGNYSMYLGLISQQIKNMAMEHKIIIVLAHQLGRTGDVAYSDMIKHAPDKVIYLKREPAPEGSEDEFTDKTFITFKKNRPHGTRPRLVMTVEKGLFIPYKSGLVEQAKRIFGAKETNQFNF